MQPTEKYYEHDAYRREAVGHILAAEPDSRTGGGRIALDGTVFYPVGADFCTAVNRISLFTCIRSGGRIAV